MGSQSIPGWKGPRGIIWDNLSWEVEPRQDCLVLCPTTASPQRALTWEVVAHLSDLSMSHFSLPQRHFCVFALSNPDQDALSRIYSTILVQHLASGNFSEAVQKSAQQLIALALGLHRKVAATFLPTAVKFHYVFNLRDFSNIFQVSAAPVLWHLEFVPMSQLRTCVPLAPGEPNTVSHPVMTQQGCPLSKGGDLGPFPSSSLVLDGFQSRHP